MAGGFQVNVSLDPASLEALHRFANYEAVLDPALYKAMEASISVIQASATDYMWSRFRNPSGTMEEAWDAQISSRESILTNTVPYARRRNYGFSGMTDALGRFYPNDPGILWAENTVGSATTQLRVATQFQAAIDYANLQLGRGAA